MRAPRTYARYGWFSTCIDNGAKVYNDSYGLPNLPIQLLYSSSGLGEGTHELVFTNEALTYQPWNTSMGGAPRLCECLFWPASVH